MKTIGGLMLSRVADNLYWMSRYLERAEHSCRLLDVQLYLMLDQSLGSAEQRWKRLLASLFIPEQAALLGDIQAAARTLTFELSSNASIAASIAAARENARHVREQISSEMWEQINRLYLYVKRASREEVWNAQPHEFFRSVKEGAHLFQGITDSTMNHGEGWQFIQAGRSIERAGLIAALIDVHFSRYIDGRHEILARDDYLEWVGLLKCLTAFEAYCKVYTADLRSDRIASFLLLNSEFPHSLRFSIDRVIGALTAIASSTLTRSAERLERLAGRLQSELSFGQIDEIMAAGLHSYLEGVQRQCAQIHKEIYQVYIGYPIATAIAS
jgi:uncharacterized alpha-E superfamily protein